MSQPQTTEEDVAAQQTQVKVEPLISHDELKNLPNVQDLRTIIDLEKQESGLPQPDNISQTQSHFAQTPLVSSSQSVRPTTEKPMGSSSHFLVPPTQSVLPMTNKSSRSSRNNRHQTSQRDVYLTPSPTPEPFQSPLVSPTRPATSNEDIKNMLLDTYLYENNASKLSELPLQVQVQFAKLLKGSLK